ncbi:MAG: tetratricopeptide repeat protein [Neobacillus sp.]
MYKELVMPTEITIKDKKKILKGTVTRAAIFARSKVVDVRTEENDRFFLVYYKNSFIYGDKLGHVEEGSFINKAFHEGVVVESPHPILTALIPNKSVTIPNKNKLLSLLQMQYSLKEMAYIATTLDTFFEKEHLINIIDKVYFHYRRSGNFIKSFQVIQILSEFAPTFKSANERLNSKEFNTYHDFYNSSSLPSIQKKDPLFIELHCFQNRSNPDKRIFLEEILEKQDCIDNLLLLWLEKVEKHQKAESIEKFTGIALRLVTMEEWILILIQVKINPYRVLSEPKAIIEKLIQKGRYETAALYLLNFIHDLPPAYDAILNILWGNLNAGFVVSHLDDFIFMLKQLVHKDNSKQSEQKIFQLAVLLLEVHSLKTVLEKLSPIQKLLPHSVVIPKMTKMLGLLEDPDRMMELGDYYAEFKQFDKAIDCFYWEMELKPQDPSPVQKISKMYQHKGMVKEAAAYIKIYDQLKSNQETG